MADSRLPGFLLCAFSEFERAATIRSDGSPAVEPAVFADAEQAFFDIVNGDEALMTLHDRAMKLGKRHQFPLKEHWPRRSDFAELSNLKALQGHALTWANAWSGAYGLPIESLVILLQTIAVSNRMFALIPVGHRMRAIGAEGSHLWKLLKQHAASVGTRLEGAGIVKDLSPEVRERLPAVVLSGLLSERPIPRMGGSDLSGVWAGMDYLPCVEMLSAAPLAAWEEGVKKAVAQVKLEERLTERGADRVQWPLARKARREKTPVYLTLNALGLRLPDEPWMGMAAEIRQRFAGGASGNDLTEMALLMFAEELARVVVRHGVLRGVFEVAKPDHANEIAKCVPQAFVWDYYRVQDSIDKSSAKRVPSAKSLLAIYWAAIAQAWPIAYRLLPGQYQVQAQDTAGYVL